MILVVFACMKGVNVYVGELLYETMLCRCHTPIFNLRSHFHISLGPRIFFAFLRKISAESYFKIAHFRLLFGPTFYIFFYFIFVFFMIFIFYHFF